MSALASLREATRNGGLRWFLVIVLINGLAPSVPEAMETVVHYVRTGHIPHATPGEDDLGDQGTEHSCGATYHRCDCCTASPSTAAAQRYELSPQETVPALSSQLPLRKFASRSLEAPFRPPIS